MAEFLEQKAVQRLLALYCSIKEMINVRYVRLAVHDNDVPQDAFYEFRPNVFFVNNNDILTNLSL